MGGQVHHRTPWEQERTHWSKVAPMANFAQDAASTPACIKVAVRYEWLLLDYPSPPMQVPGMYAS